ncbi:Crp/Fnr family transcriptional regulator [Thiorhodococcus mannitoliphagus]|uniref:Crp/Fnr family transcriptional regulator n=1 Tax=Thiorhodococcus mannitoliphagus TaxID=329406 RepID=A0A6P1DTJ0_9GAMM|nr:Crp/Fnr family transcriptional regulator [Thiorhodococcus mannitoliphagus]NEX19004.1 Crp/Fnr family transcriptional regulator [Thiorhodococcus mannitoliphagus]
MINTPDQRERLLAAFPFLADSDARLREAFFQRAVMARLPAGHIICHDGGECSQLALVLAGRARIYKLGENGREVTLYRIEPGESCVVTASCILSNRPFPAFAVCETDVEAAVVAKSDVETWLTASPSWRAFVFALVAERIGEVFSVLDAVLFQPLDQRLAAYLLGRCERASPPSRIVRITHQELASELGSSREVVTRALRDFEQAGALLTGRGQIDLVNPDVLKARVRRQS